MITIENTEVNGIVRAVYAARNAMNSWNKSDSDLTTNVLGANDLDLAKRLAKAGSVHGKFMRMINVTCDITAPRYFWVEADTYKVGTVRNSCSTMHTIHSKEFTFEDFSHEHLNDNNMRVLNRIIEALNESRTNYLKTKDKEDWWQLIQLLPASYNQRATWQANYEVLRGIYFYRRHHRLDEWHDFCSWIEQLPYSELITTPTVIKE